MHGVFAVGGDVVHGRGSVGLGEAVVCILCMVKALSPSLERGSLPQ